MAFASSRMTRSMTRVSGFRDAEFDYQLLRAMGVADYGGSTVGECLAAAGVITDGDTGSWVRAFGALADRVEAQGRQSLAAGHRVSGRDHLLRASTYHRMAEYYADADRVALSESGRRSRACFEEAVALLDTPVEPVSMPFEGSALPGYLIHPFEAGGAATARPTGTLVALGGFDSSAEELYFQLGAAGATRRWQVLVFDGPGQTGAMRDDPTLCFRPDYEVPVGAVLDFVESRSDTRPEHLALAGLSLGGYLAARAAACDRRVKALVADSPIVDLYRYMEALIGPEVFRMRSDVRPEDVVGIPEDLLPAQMMWGMAAVCRRFGVRSLHEWLGRLDRFRLGDIVADISCPVLALVGEHEGHEVTRQADEFAAGVSGPVTVRRFGIDDGADAHCQANNLRLSASVVYDWLDELFVERSS